ncbi:histidine kinase/DNA gyrase B/HSP90-like ATPase [Azotobacter chroococcum]|uniref:Histidine kinase/DNA gyrase B/HSP90-like ATPase n=2 Tax=Azotobacter chroococcum TaxID=353 RepID=A0A4R1PNF9_9GAMM|nr:histidine kinase/DNA gyrase B/HSP90-like ATPase [Azotobacter chroococcum]
MMTQRARLAPPRAGAMLEALRGLGYSTAAALADVIDNSVSAGASEVHVRFDWDGYSSRISVQDDGRGMNDAELETAMTLGAKNPLDERAPTDLGRFGMGLKTASFSQCRRLTVAAKKMDAPLACLRWDLDAIAASPDDGWRMFEGPADGSEPFIESIGGLRSGTIVLWERLDRIVTPGYDIDHFADLVDDVEMQLAMIFHRLLEGPNPAFRLFINGKSVNPWDPFMMGHPAKPWQSPVARILTLSGAVEAQCHVLPHKDRLSADDFQKAGGPEGWTSQQGFYVYRNRRLLLAGGWLGLGQGRAWNREESHRLARIRLDIPNTSDADWKIDVKKSTARPPVSVRPWLTKLAEDTRERARRVFAFRGAPAPGPGGVQVEEAWRVERLRDGIRYRIDEGHPAVAAVLEAIGGRTDLVRAMLRVVEETVPVQRIWLDTAENKETPKTGFSGEPEESPEGVRTVLLTLYRDMTGRRGMSSEAAVRALSCTDPFHNYPALVASLPGVDRSKEGTLK